jgi:DNA-binding NarL/FixJ family response regulator
MNPIKVMVVDDHAVVRDGLRALLATRTDIDVVGVAADGVQAIHVARECQPQVVLMDLGMPRMGGVEATRRITALQPAPIVIALTMSDEDTSVIAAVRAGARGYLLKDADGDEVVAAIHAVTGGQAVFGHGVASIVLGLLNTPPARQQPPFPELSNREREILSLVASGLGNQAIARRLAVSTKTVANTVSTVLVKLGVPDRAHAAAAARTAGLGRQPVTGSDAKVTQPGGLASTRSLTKEEYRASPRGPGSASADHNATIPAEAGVCPETLGPE